MPGSTRRGSPTRPHEPESQAPTVGGRVIRIEFPTQGGATAGQPARDRPLRDRQHPPDLGLGVAVDHVEQECRPRPGVQRVQCRPQVRVGRVAPRSWLDPGDRREPATSAPEMVERQAQRDRIQPGPDVRAVEPVPGSKCLEVGVLCDVLGVALVPEDEDESPEEVRVVRPNGRLEVAHAVRRGGAVPAGTGGRLGGQGGTRSPGAVHGRHGIGRSTQAPPPDASTRWSMIMWSRPSSRIEPGTT